MDALLKLSKKLNISSIKNFNNPYTSIEWPEEIDLSEWSFSPEYISIYHTETFREMSEQEQKRLSFYEAVNFFSLNISGERELISGLSLRLYKKYPKEITDYLHHFLDEENKHMLWFGTFCEKYAGKVYPDKKIFFPREYVKGEEEFLFFAKIVIFEEIVDAVNVYMGRDERLSPLIRQIHKQHHIDESRHLNFGRNISKYLFDLHSKNDWSDEVIQRIRTYLGGYMLATWKEYYNPSVYSDAVLDSPHDVMEEGWSHPKSQKFREEICRRCIDFFLKEKILIERPEL